LNQPQAKLFYIFQNLYLNKRNIVVTSVTFPKFLEHIISQNIVVAENESLKLTLELALILRKFLAHASQKQLSCKTRNLIFFLGGELIGTVLCKYTKNVNTISGHNVEFCATQSSHRAL
jgi:chromosomal replication initiation ATPase DnaA